MRWWCMSIILCSYGFLKEFRPSDSFFTPFLITFKNFTMQEINQKIFPVITYSYLSLLILVFLLTDLLRYKPVLLVGSVSGVVTWSLLIWGTTIQEMQAMEFFYALFVASEVAYFSYIYGKVDAKHYQKVTSHTRAAILLGRAIGGLSSQVAPFHNYLTRHVTFINSPSFAAVGITVLVALFLPRVPRSIYFHRRNNNSDKVGCDGGLPHPESVDFEKKVSQEIEQNTKFTLSNCQTAFKLLYEDLKQFLKNPYVLQWSIWWALATCGNLQIIPYTQLQWNEIAEAENTTLYHGYAEFVYAVLGAVFAFIVGYIRINWRKWGEVFLGVLTIGQGGLLFYSAHVKKLYVAYATYVMYRAFYEAAITVATYEIARLISPDSYALVFGINTFAALLFQTILTAVVVELLGIQIQQQFEIYGCFHFSFGLIFLVYGISRLLFCRGRTKKITEETSS